MVKIAQLVGGKVMHLKYFHEENIMHPGQGRYPVLFHIDRYMDLVGVFPD
jgi:hypothetical protein